MSTVKGRELSLFNPTMLFISAQSFYSRLIPSLLLSLALLLLPLGAILEHRFPSLWQERLLLANLSPVVSRHTPIYFTGTFLPPLVKKDLTLTPNDSPILLTGHTVIPPSVTVTLTPGTQIFVHEFGALEVSGKLLAQGTAAQPIIFNTNEAHLRNQLWNGLTLNSKSRAELSYVKIQHASPAITCLENSSLAADHLTINLASTGIYTQSANCIVSHSALTHVRNGIITIKNNPQFQSVIINATEKDIQIFEN